MRRCALLMPAILITSGAAVAAPVFTIIYDPGVSFTLADKAVIQSAVNFYASNMESNFAVTVAFGEQAGGGGASQWFTDTSTYSAYYSALVANSSGKATDTSAIVSLGGGPHTTNPVTGSGNIVTTSTLASALGIGSQVSDVFASCGGLTANACITLSSAALNTGASPLAGLFGIVQHEFDEVLGTASNLPNGGGTVPADPMAADLYRYAAPGVRSFALNSSTSVPCTGSTAYLSVNGGATNLNNYNNCNNGGDYGDWIGTDGLQVQDAFGPDTQAASLNLTSPEVTLLDAVGYNFSASSAVPEPSMFVMVFVGLITVPLLRRRRA